MRVTGMATGVAPRALMMSPWSFDGVRIFMPLTSSRVRTALLRVMMTALSLVHSARTLVLAYSP